MNTVDINVFNKITPAQRAAEEQCMRQLEMLESRIFNREMARQEKQLAEEEPRLAYMTPAQIIQEDDIRRATCTLCGMLCQSETHMLQHRDMLRCRKQQAKNKGETYVPENKRPVHCDICDKTMQQQRWSQHVNSNAHKLNVIISDERAFYCPICDKNFTSGTRPKRMLKNHLSRSIHLRKLSHPKNRESHDAICKLHGFEFDTTKLLQKMQRVVKIV